MKALFTVHPMLGHFHAMAPLALALKEHGHEVAVATGARFGSVVQRLGLMHFPCGLDFDGSRDIFEAFPEWKTLQAGDPAASAIRQLYGFVEGLGPKMAEDLMAQVDRWRPDLIVRDPLEYGGYIVAEREGLPYATITWAVYIATQRYCPDGLTKLRRRYGLCDDSELEAIDRYLVLSFLPPSWTFPDSPAQAVTHRYCAPPFDQSGNEAPPDWVTRLPARPTVYATLGTTFNQSPGTFRAIVDALGAEAINVIMTTGRWMDPAQFEPYPTHMRIERYIPQTVVMPHCDAVIFHGGYNTLLAALWHGLPMVLTPLGGGDQLPNAQRCAELGVGILVEGTPPEPEAIRAAVRSVLEQPAYRTRARQLQQELKALPGLSEAVRGLQVLAQTRDPQPSGDSAC